ncbi:MAG TPA: hypothetical protein VEA38_13560 [Terriglobales bacterium]|nr:hypothetical protein [Terriglobales bacterium]
MARTVTLSSLRTAARRLADVENDSTITDAELTDLVNRHLTEVYDLLVEAGPTEYYASDTTVTTERGRIAYPLQADFRSLVGVYVHETGTERRAVRPMAPGERGRYRAPNAVYTVTLEYVPTPPTLADAGVNTFDGVSGWDELIANLAARDVMVKREADPSVVINTIDRLMARINASAARRDYGGPKRIMDADEVDYRSNWSTDARVSAYRLRAGNIELFEPAWYLP